MKEDFYTILMRKVIMGVSTQYEEQVLFDWMDQDSNRLKTFSLISITMSLDDPDLWERMEEQTQGELKTDSSEITKKELLQLLKAFLDEVRRGGVGDL